MNLFPDAVSKVRDFENHEDILVGFIAAIEDKTNTSVLDLMVNFICELEGVRGQLLQEYTNCFINGTNLHETIKSCIRYQRFVEFIRNLNMMRYLCRNDLRTLGFKFEACDSKVEISKGHVRHYDNETIVEHGDYMYIIHEGDDDLGCFLDFVMDADGSLLVQLAEDHTKFNKKIDKEKIEDLEGALG